jgi:hypothetical protein
LLRRCRLDNLSNTGMFQTGLHQRMPQSHRHLYRWCIKVPIPVAGRSKA